MKENNLIKLSYFSLIIPIIIFLLGFVKIYLSIPFSLLLFLIYFKICKANKSDKVIINKKNLLIVAAVVLVIAITSGVGGLFYQSYDYHWRNAIFRDLINFDWPVQYQSMDTFLVYYIGIWMVPALFGKLGLFVSTTFAWNLANIVLLMWISLLVILVILQVIRLFRIKKFKYILLVLFLFLFFSGLDYIGAKIYYPELFTEYIHLEWWTADYQYNSMITQLFWVFNQAIVPWLITLIFIQEETVCNYMLLILLCLPYGPLPFLGMIPLFLEKGVEFLVRSIKTKKIFIFLKNVFSFQNVFSFISILPVFYFYYSSNASLNEAGFRFALEVFKNKEINLLIFWLLEVGIYWLLLLKANYKKPLFWVVGVTLFLVPLFKIGYSTDFSMRVSIPALVILAIYFINEIINGKCKLIKVLLLITFVIGLATPYYEYKRAIVNVKESKKINCVADDIKTFSDKNYEDYQNFVSKSYKNSIFFKYISR